MDIRIFFRLTIIMVIVCISAVVITTGMLYMDEFREYQEILIQIANRQKRLIESIILFNKDHTIKYHPDEVLAASNLALSEAIKMIQRAREEGGAAGDIEVATAVLKGDNVFFISFKGKKNNKEPTIAKMGSNIAIAMQLALKGKTGVIRSVDYKGHDVLAAYTYVDEVKLGIVAKSNISSISRRFITGAIFATMPAFVLVMLGAWLFYRLTIPVINKLRDEAERFRTINLEKIKALRDLKESEHRLKCFFDAAFEGIAICKDEKFIDSNQRFAEVFGYRQEEIIGMPITNLVYPDDVKLVMDHIAEGYEEPYEHRSVKKDGSIVYVIVHGQQTQYKGEIVRITTVHDLTEHKNALTKIETLYKRQRHTSKMEAIGNFATGIAHDFNNSLSPIVGNCDLLLLRMDKNDPNREPLYRISAAANTAALLVRRIQSFTYKDSSDDRLVPIRLKNCIVEAYDFVRSITPTSIHMELNIDDGIGVVATTEVMIRQILMNLCKNAASAMDDEQGSIIIDVTRETVLVERFGLTSGDYVRISVEDDGCGMPEKVLERAIDPYFTTKTDKSGSGLGLAVVNGILDAHGGIIHLQSSEDAGTIATVFLPALKDNGSALPYCSIDEPLPHGHGERILFVDDEKNITDMAQQVMKTLNYDVVAFNDSTEAFKAFCVNPTIYDVLLTDMIMPSMGGISLVQRVKEISPEIKVILSSGLGNDGRANSDMWSHLIDAYLQKPVTIRHYAVALAHVFKEDNKNQL